MFAPPSCSINIRFFTPIISCPGTSNFHDLSAVPTARYVLHFVAICSVYIVFPSYLYLYLHLFLLYIKNDFSLRIGNFDPTCQVRLARDFHTPEHSFKRTSLVNPIISDKESILLINCCRCYVTKDAIWASIELKKRNYIPTIDENNIGVFFVSYFQHSDKKKRQDSVNSVRYGKNEIMENETIDIFVVKIKTSKTLFLRLKHFFRKLFSDFDRTPSR